MTMVNDGDDGHRSGDSLCAALSGLVYTSLLQVCGGDVHDTVIRDCDGACRCEALDSPPSDHGVAAPARWTRVVDDTSCRHCWHGLLRSMAESTVIRAKNKQWCIEIRTAPAYFSRFGSNKKGRSSSSMDETPPHKKNQSVTVVSSYGLERTLQSCSELGQLLLLELEEMIRQHSDDDDNELSSLWIRKSPTNGMIYVTTSARLWELRSQGMFPCPHCPNWFRGLWWHVQKQHLHTHAQARQEQLKHDTSRALVVYRASQAPPIAAPTATTTIGDARDDAAPSITVLPTDAKGISMDADAWELVKRGDVTALQHYLASNPSFDPSSSRDDKGALLLHWAAGGGHIHMVQYLIINCNCDPDARQLSRRSFGGRTALHWAARNGYVNVVEYLLGDDVKANAAAETQDGTTAFGWAAWQGHLAVLRCLHVHDPDLAKSVNRFGCNAVLWAAQGTFDDPDMTVVRFLDSIGCDLFMINGNGHGLLHKAAQRGRREMAEWFVEKLASSLLDQDDGITRDEDIHTLVLRRQPDLVERLLGPDAEGCTPSDLAGIEDYTDLALYLAQQERRLILLHIQRTRPKAEKVRYPSWLDRGAPVQVAGTGCYHWEAWAGVGRMREAVLAASTSDASY